MNPGGITGSVVDSKGNAIAGATVTGAGLTATTNASGAYTLSNVPAGSVVLTASAPTYQPASETVTVTTGNTTTAPAIMLVSNLGNVTGKVTDTSSDRVPSRQQHGERERRNVHPELPAFHGRDS